MLPRAIYSVAVIKPRKHDERHYVPKSKAKGKTGLRKWKTRFMAIANSLFQIVASFTFSSRFHPYASVSLYLVYITSNTSPKKRNGSYAGLDRYTLQATSCVSTVVFVDVIIQMVFFDDRLYTI